MSVEDFGIRALVAAIEQIGVGYFLGGSIASSVHGIPRTTMDIDIVAALPAYKIHEFVKLLAPQFYIDEDAANAALQDARPFNLIHYASAYKYDIFPLPDDPYYATE